MANTTEAELDFVLSATRAAQDFVQTIDRMLGAVIVGLEELQRVRRTIKQGSPALDWAAFLAEYEKEDASFAHALRQTSCESFAVGRLELIADDSVILSYLKLCKDRLQRALSDKYGAKFRVKIIDPK